MVPTLDACVLQKLLPHRRISMLRPPAMVMFLLKGAQQKHVCSAGCDIPSRGAVPVTVQHEVHRMSTITPPHARNDQQAALHHRASHPTLTGALSASLKIHHSSVVLCQKLRAARLQGSLEVEIVAKMQANMIKRLQHAG
jgi:hypothetical protein